MSINIVRFIPKYQRFKNGEALLCKKHGTHRQWRLYRERDVQCKICMSDHQKTKRRKNPIYYMLCDARAHAKKKGIMFDLVMGDIQFLLEKQNNRCALSGVSFKEEMFSIDKINPFGNYTKFNIQLLTISVNRMKSNFPQDVFLRICANIAGHQQEPDDAT